MEKLVENNKYMENSTIPHSFKKNELKLGGEEYNKPIIMNNNINDINNNVENTKERIQFLFPNLSPTNIKEILERSENNIEKAIILIMQIENQKKLNNSKNPMNQELDNKRKQQKGINKRNYNSIIQQDKNTNEINEIINHIQVPPNQNINKNEIINHVLVSPNQNIYKNVNQINLAKNPMSNTYMNNKLNSDINIQNNKIDLVQHNNLNNNNELRNKDENSNIDNSIDETKTNLLNNQVQFLMRQFSQMTDISELKQLLKEIGFPEKIENNENNENSANDNNKLAEILKEKVASNKEEKEFIKNQYKKYNDVLGEIEKNEEKIEELTSTLGNLIDAECEQKMREEKYKNEILEFVRIMNENNTFNNPREGY